MVNKIQLLLWLANLENLKRIKEVILYLGLDASISYTELKSYLSDEDIHLLVTTECFIFENGKYTQHLNSVSWLLLISTLCYCYSDFEEWWDTVTLNETTLVDNDELISQGREYGYPECCISYFIKNVRCSSWESYIKSTPLLGTGYVPCPNCKTKSLEELITQIDIKRNMEYYPFPIEAKKGKVAQLLNFTFEERVKLINKNVVIAKLENNCY